MISKKKILVRVDGSKGIGLGHVYNIITILNHLKKNELLIVMNSKKRLGERKFKKFNFKVTIFSKKNELLKIIEKFQPDIIFNDILNTKVSYMKSLRKFHSLIVNFEDLGKGRKYADLIFNPIFYSKSKSKNEFYGHKFACVRNEFRASKKARLHKNVKRIVITFGGTDPTDKTARVMKILRNCDLQKIEIIVILGLGYSKKKRLRQLVKEMTKKDYNITIVEKSDNLSKYFRNCDFAITSNGRTVFEIAAMRIPMIAIAVNNRERSHSFVRFTNSGFHIDMDTKEQDKLLINKIKEMMKIETRKKFIKNMQKTDLLGGISRVIQIINTQSEKMS